MPSSELSCRSDEAPPAGGVIVRHETALLVAICAVGFVLRLLAVVAVPNLYRPDAIFQTIEQAHRIVYGTGVVPWEFVYGARSWLLPGVLAGVMGAARLVGDGPDYYLPMIAGLWAALSTSCVVIAFLWGKRFDGVAGGIVAAVAVALSADAIYYGARSAPEVIGAHVTLVATYLCEPGYLARSKRRLFAAGLLFGLAFLLRFQYAAAIGLVILWTGLRAPRWRLPPIVAGAVIVVLLGGLLDGITWSYPFESIWRNLVINAEYGVADDYGVTPWYAYFIALAWYWGAGAAVLLFLALLGSTRLPLLLAAAAAVVLAHSLIPHKEIGFIYLGILLVVVLAALGLARIVVWTAAHLAADASRLGVTAACVLAAIEFWTIFSFGEAASAGYMSRWDGDANTLAAALDVARLQAVCGVGLWGVKWDLSGGYTYMNEPGRLYLPATPRDLAADAPGFNVIVYLGTPPEGFGFVRKSCHGAVCVAERAGGCAAIPAPLTPQIPPLPRSLAPERATRPQ
ncbi:MAG TPA: hypothetical protein VMU87_13015 [Stellaceae bacterium]|nr:hypothetical protein [Stellaceae bacterium]